jgi:hypothetical protein
MDWVVSHADGNCFHPGFILMDPYASAAARVLLPENAHAGAPRIAPNQDVSAPVLLGLLAPLARVPFDWQVSRPLLQPSSISYMFDV